MDMIGMMADISISSTCVSPYITNIVTWPPIHHCLHHRTSCKSWQTCNCGGTAPGSMLFAGEYSLRMCLSVKYFLHWPEPSAWVMRETLRKFSTSMKSSSCHGRVKGSHLLMDSRLTKQWSWMINFSWCMISDMILLMAYHSHRSGLSTPPAFCSASLSIKTFISGVASLCLLACVECLWPSTRASLSGVASLCLLAWALCLRSSRQVSLSGVASLCLLAWALCLRSSRWASLPGVGPEMNLDLKPVWRVRRHWHRL